MAGGNEAKDFEKTCEWMLLGLQHRVPLMNGYSGFCPQRVLDLGTELVDKPLTIDQLTRLYDQGLRYLIVERALARLPWAPAQIEAGWQLELLHSSPSGVDVYVVRRS